MGLPSTKRFTIRRRIGEGGMGVVYEAFDEDRRARVALKTLHSADGAALARFKREFRALQGIAHPNLVALDELFFEDGQWFFTMELLDGVDFVSHVTGRASSSPYMSTLDDESGNMKAGEAVGREEASGPPSFHEGRLREVLRQLLEGLAALHRLEKVHRDIKPSNVLVTREGRVALLDFGLVTEASASDRSTGSAIVGTPAYMAPEQAASGDVGPAADLYSVGVMLYEVLTGRLPIDGPLLQVLIDKQTREPAPPSSLSPDVPADLEALCQKMLQIDPSRRPSVADALRALSIARESGRCPPLPASSGSPIFVGRSAELSLLRAAFDERAKGRLATVLVCGESGIGKSYLVRRFTGELMAEHPEAMLLEGRCYERETVPYKTLDGIVDALSRRLSRMNPSEAGVLLPVRSAMLAQVFPVMLLVPEVAREHAAQTFTIEPHELRQRAFVALRELFTRVATRRPTVVVIDDLQWADDDGLRALAEILRAPDAPPLLLLGTVRLASREDDALKRVLAVIPGEPRVIDVASLGPVEARELAVAVLRRSDASHADPEAVAAEAGGHPLFVEELARHVALGGSARDGTSAPGARRGPHQTYVKLDDAIWSRVVQLDRPTREMAELVCIAGKPIPQEVAAAAAHVEPAEFNRRAATLRSANLARTGGGRLADAIEPYHDRVREAVLAQLDPARRRSLHESLAIAFEASSHHDAEMLAAHWREAGKGARAAPYAATAGDQASKAFAFDRAAQWYEQALGLVSAEHASRRELLIKLGDALAGAGRGRDAARAYLAGADGSPVALALDLRRRAAEQLLRSGEIDEAVATFGRVLAEVGLTMPKSQKGAFAALLLRRAQARMRGLGFDEKSEENVPQLDLLRVDAVWAVGSELGLTDMVVGSYFTTRGLLLALSAGEPNRVCRAIASEACFSSAGGGPTAKRTQDLVQLSQDMARRLGRPYGVAWTIAAGGMAAALEGRWKHSAEALAEADRLFVERCTGVAWELGTLRWFALLALGYLGRFNELRPLVVARVNDARARGDLYSEVTNATEYLAWLTAGEVDRARDLCRDVMERWSQKKFHVEHWWATQAEANVHLYRGDGPAAVALLVERWPALSSSLLLMCQMTRLESLHVRARASLMAACAGGKDAAGHAVAAGKDARAIAKERMPWSDPLAALLRAGLAALRGEEDAAKRELDASIAGLDAADMAAYAEAARWRRGDLVAGDAGRAERAAAEARLRALGIADPQRIVSVFAPWK